MYIITGLVAARTVRGGVIDRTTPVRGGWATRAQGGAQARRGRCGAGARWYEPVELGT